MTQLPFDVVIIREPGKPQRKLSPDEFLALPLNDRVRVLLRKELSFTLDGAYVDKDLALAALASRKRTS